MEFKETVAVAKTVRWQRGGETTGCRVTAGEKHQSHIMMSVHMSVCPQQVTQKYHIITSRSRVGKNFRYGVHYLETPTIWEG